MNQEKKQEYFEKTAHQRASVMAILHNILTMSDDKPLKEAKLMIAATFKCIIQNEYIVGDVADRMVLLRIKEYLNQERAFRAANNIVNPENPL